MNDRELARFVYENSSEPIIKNPVLRKALQPRLGFYLGKSVPSQGTIEDADTKKAEDALGGINEVMKVADLQRQGHIGHFYAKGGRIGFKDGSGGVRERTDLQFENLTRKENAKRLKLSTTNALGYRALPDYPNITYTDYRNKKTGKKFRTYGVRIRRQDKKATTAATPRTGDFSNIPTLKEAIKVRDKFREENPLNIKPADPKKAKITKGTRRTNIKGQGGVEDFLVAEEGTGVQKGHAGNIKKRKITPSSIIYTPTEVNVGMAGQEGVKGAKETFTDLDYKIDVAENKIKKIKRSKKPLPEKKRLLDIQDKLLTDYHFQSGGFKTPTLSDGTIFGESTRKALSMDQMDLFPNMTERESKKFVRQYISEKGTLKPFYQRLVDSGDISEIDIENIKKSKVFLDNVESAKKNAKNFDVPAMKRLAAIGCPGKAMGGRIGFFKGQNLNACAAKGLQKLKTTDVKELTYGDKANIKAITKTIQGGRLLKNVLGPGALAFEGLFAAPFAAYDYARGRPGEDIFKSALTLGLLDQKLTDDELKKIFPEYGQGAELENIGDRLTDLERLQKGTKGQRIRSKYKIQKLNEEFKTALQPFLDTGDAGKAYRENMRKSQEARDELERQYNIRKQNRTTQFDLSNPFMAAGGGIASLPGVRQGPAPLSGPLPDGLPFVPNRVKKI